MYPPSTDMPIGLNLSGDKRSISRLIFFAQTLPSSVREETDVKRSTAAAYHAGIRSWLKYNAKSLRGFTTPEAYSESIPPITMEELREILAVMDPREAFFTLFLKDSGVSQAEALQMNYGDIRKQFEAGKQYISIKVFREKEHVDYETLIGPNTIEALKTFLNIRKRRGETITDDTPLFVTHRKPYERLQPTGIGQVYQRITAKTGIKVATHRLRKFFETYMALGKIHPIILKYWTGHKVKGGKSDIEAKYIILPTREQLKLYMAAYKHIDVTPQRDEWELFVAETKARTQGMTPEQKRRFVKQLATRRPDLMEHPDIKKIIEESTKEGGLPAQPNFKEINEAELLVYLQNGYSIVHNLQNGKLIIRKG